MDHCGKISFLDTKKESAKSFNEKKISLTSKKDGNNSYFFPIQSFHQALAKYDREFILYCKMEPLCVNTNTNTNLLFLG